MGIRNCRDKRTSDFLTGKHVKAFQSFAQAGAKAIVKLQVVRRLVDLRNPPPNRFEALSGTRKGQYSIRINDQWRICFEWEFANEQDADLDPLMRQGEPAEVEITDYH